MGETTKAKGVEFLLYSPDREETIRELLWLVQRAAGIRHPDYAWIKADVMRSWADWDNRARALLAELEAKP